MKDEIEHLIRRFFHSPKFIRHEDRVFRGEKTEVQNCLFNTFSGTITLGDYVFCGMNVSMLTGSHDYTLKGLERQKAVPTQGYDIVIGKGVWIGSCATIIGPCEIGDDSVIAAGSVVLPGKYEAGCLYAGNPATKKKEIKFK